MKERPSQETGFNETHTYTERAERYRKIVQDIDNLERKKTLSEISLIRQADTRTTRVLQFYGVKSPRVEVEQIKVISESAAKNCNSFTVNGEGYAVIPEADKDPFLHETMHEMLHLKGSNYLPVPVTEAIVEMLTCQSQNVDKSNLVGAQVFSGRYSYVEESKIMDDLIRKVVATASPDVTDFFHTFSFFAKAHLTGDRSLIDFLDRLFGQGTVNNFESITDTASFKNFVNNLR